MVLIPLFDKFLHPSTELNTKLLNFTKAKIYDFESFISQQNFFNVLTAYIINI